MRPATAAAAVSRRWQAAETTMGTTSDRATPNQQNSPNHPGGAGHMNDRGNKQKRPQSHNTRLTNAEKETRAERCPHETERRERTRLIYRFRPPCMRCRCPGCSRERSGVLHEGAHRGTDVRHQQQQPLSPEHGKLLKRRWERLAVERHRTSMHQLPQGRRSHGCLRGEKGKRLQQPQRKMTETSAAAAAAVGTWQAA